MRLFIGIFLPEEILDYLYQVQTKLKQNLPAKITWVHKKILHFNLKFIGEVYENKINEIKERLNKIKFKSFRIKLDKIGVFPNENYIRIIWVGLKPAGKIIELQQKIDSELLDLFPKDQRFSPHMTLGRVKFIKDKEQFKKNLKLEIAEKEFEVNEFCLVKSELSKDGSKYEILETYNLA
ncbi:MAG: RNA 2',3'-cyclic phosphodiesterase [Nanoarchaeota archaeon]